MIAHRSSLIGSAAVVAATLGALAMTSAASAQSKTPSFTDAQAKRGAALYADNCAVCHGSTLDNNTDIAPALKGQGYKDYWKGKSAGDVLTYITTMMPSTQPGALGPKGSADAYAYILQQNGAPAGATELAAPIAAGAAIAP